MSETAYERIGRLIYGTHRHGASMGDLTQWIAAELGEAPSGVAEDASDGAAFTACNALMEKYVSDAEFDGAFARCMQAMKDKAA